LKTSDPFSPALQAIGVQPTANGGVVMISKRPGNPNRPAQNTVTVTWNPNASNRK